jgi:uncharacterized protein YggE
MLSAVSAYCEVEPRLVTVTGEGEVMTVPNEVWLNLQMESFDPILSKAKKSNDDAIKQVLVIVKKYHVDEKDFKTDYFNVRNGDRYFMDPQTNQQRSKRGYFVTKNVSILLRDVTKFEALYSDALEAGINNITGVEFKTSELKKLRDQARVLAVQAAKEKAEKLAAELGQEIGRPHAIHENLQVEPWSGPRMMSKMAMAENVAVEPNNETIALGQIKISASVTVSFELK